MWPMPPLGQLAELEHGPALVLALRRAGDLVEPAAVAEDVEVARALQLEREPLVAVEEPAVEDPPVPGRALGLDRVVADVGETVAVDIDVPVQAFGEVRPAVEAVDAVEGVQDAVVAHRQVARDPVAADEVAVQPANAGLVPVGPVGALPGDAAPQVPARHVLQPGTVLDDDAPCQLAV